MLVKALAGPVMALLAGLGTLRWSVVTENYLLLSLGMLLAVVGMLRLMNPLGTRLEQRAELRALRLERQAAARGRRARHRARRARRRVGHEA